ncbi:MAG: tRNA (N(6)-L-threonylcarbamoyladenosine(37)-C(2))-methylthiotransferase MtaB [Puniceicoccales bacterium]|jgi:threonylcarbamoyladenosine tRNA methylthiotransferase MtaB|nr:tRNA (N(6)-L-threonylcarbamoyladenosine(37)-C(2))-methylthiotransferase MtaB [Puniceicoccales bacterium]
MGLDASTSKRASLHTLGCRLNQAETMLLRDKLAASGYTMVPFGEKADLAIINTCTVTRLADAKCRQSIRQFITENPHAYTAVVGCYSQMGAKEIASIPGVDLILGNQDKLNVLEYIGTGEKNSTPVIVRDRISRDDFSIAFAGERPFNKRANLKVQEGCDFVCSFCIIPFARGRARSRDFLNMLDEANSLASRGVRELVLTGVNIGTYGNGGCDIVNVVDALAQVPGIDRLRISSIEPTTVPPELLDRMADPQHPLLPYLHLPLQSGCNRILHDMRRRYTTEEYAEFARDAVQRIPELCLGADIMIGFPGETEEEFDETCRFLLENPFSYAHVFTYSEREGTPAARRSDQVPVPLRQKRSAHLRRLSAQRLYDFHAKHLGRTVKVLFEDPSENTWPGYTDNYIRVVIPAAQVPGKDLANQMGWVRLDTVTADFVEGTWIQTAED